ncbi:MULTISPECIES: hypothetical protein [unclassified Archaeoglobus]|jgi:hypothetical protein|uniref:hypothetical protein n=1 Tax=unclassified Archaeoglobus TaxID=2643606 RepID=UPI0025C4374A|nr:MULTISPECIES: hypothetical protein [unclassified Archaeoglobus]
MTDFVKLLDKIWNREELQIYKIKRGKNFLLTLKLDLEKVLEIVNQNGIHVDKNGLISGDELAPITVSLLSEKGETPGEETFVGILSFRIHYHGISPELENFVSIVLWPSKKSKQTLEKILLEVSGRKDRALKFEGNYRIRLPNEVHPYRAERISVEESKVYEWLYAPYFKEIGETIFARVSPINFRKIYIRTIGEEYEKKYVNLKTCVGIVKNIRDGEVSLKIPYLDSQSRKRSYIVKYHRRIQNKVETLKKGDKVAFLVFEEVNSSNEDSHIPEHVIFQMERVDTGYILGHILSFFLYNYYLLRKRLLVMERTDFKKVFNFLQNITYRFCKDVSDIHPQFLENVDLFFSAYLSPFFMIHGDEIYFKPFYLRSKIRDSLDIILRFDQKLRFGDSIEIIDLFCLHKDCKIIEKDSIGSLVYCPLHRIKLREGAELCKECEFHHLGPIGKSLQKQFNFMKFLLSLKSTIHSERLARFAEIIEKLNI